jgi:long-chain acyl-CoA synthetase
MTTIRDFFAAHVKTRPNDPCWMTKSAGTWRTFSFVQADQMIQRTAAALAAQGVQQGSIVVIWANTCMEWVVVDMACWTLGAVSVPIYFNTMPDQAAPILANCTPTVILAEDVTRAAEALSHWGRQVPILDLQQSVGKWIATPSGQTLPHVTLAENDLASIVYTSGTTGEPKGVDLTHGNFAAEVVALRKLFDIPTHYTSLGFLPLSHIVARAVQCFQLSHGFVMAFAESIEKVADNLKEVQPHFFVSVPRIFEKIYAKVFAEVAHLPKMIQSLFQWGQRSSSMVVKRTIFRKIYNQLGGRLQFAISGGAPLNPEIARFFDSLGLPIYEGYGLTETAAAICVNYKGHNCYGTVGKPLDCVALRFDVDGEILFKGPVVFRGYHLNPEATRESFTSDGFFRTGDIGELTPEGYLKITDRKKDLIVTAGGKKVAPQPIEQALMQSPYVAQAMVYGDRRPYVTALIVPNQEAVMQVVQKLGLKAANWPSMVQSPEVVALFQKIVDGINHDLSRYETIKHFHLVPQEFTMQQGELTPTLKLKRKVIQERYASELNALYG